MLFGREYAGLLCLNNVETVSLMNDKNKIN